MTKYYTYRLKEEDFPEDTSMIPIQDTPEKLDEGDVFLVFVSGSLDVLGIYTKDEDNLRIENRIDDMKLSDFYECFSFVTFVNDRTYKMFSKRVKEISEKDYHNILSTAYVAQWSGPGRTHYPASFLCAGTGSCSYKDRHHVWYAMVIIPWQWPAGFLSTWLKSDCQRHKPPWSAVYRSFPGRQSYFQRLAPRNYWQLLQFPFHE